MGMQQVEASATRFEFGKNWVDFLRHVDTEAVRNAEEWLARLVPPRLLAGARFIDIGCGSGLHSLAALRLGVSELMAIDLDPDSVAATKRLLGKTLSDQVLVRQMSIFDATPDELGQFDVVYSWGVLHHTGAMWRAIEKAAALVKPGGWLAIALYQRTPLCWMWKLEKRIYTRSPRPIRALIKAFYSAAVMSVLALRGRNPIAHIRSYKADRGMNFFNDIHDWLGGFPYESAAPGEVIAFLRAHDFEVVIDHSLPSRLGLLGTGCAEFAFRKGRQDAPTSHERDNSLRSDLI